MTDEIIKLYKNAGIEKEVIKGCYEYYSENGGIDIYTVNDCKNKDCNTCKADKSIKEYPPFTAEKQIELINFFSNNYNISINKDNNIFRLLFINKDGVHNFYTSGVDFAEQLALFVISRYKNQILSEEEKQQIKEILE